MNNRKVILTDIVNNLKEREEVIIEKAFTYSVRFIYKGINCKFLVMEKVNKSETKKELTTMVIKVSFGDLKDKTFKHYEGTDNVLETILDYCYGEYNKEKKVPKKKQDFQVPPPYSEKWSKNVECMITALGYKKESIQAQVINLLCGNLVPECPAGMKLSACFDKVMGWRIIHNKREKFVLDNIDLIDQLVILIEEEGNKVPDLGGNDIFAYMAYIAFMWVKLEIDKYNDILSLSVVA